MTKTTDARGAITCVRGATIPAVLWQRVVLGGIADDVWSSGTARLAGSDLVGGSPAVVMTGITFKRASIEWLIAHHAGTPQAQRQKQGSRLQPLVANDVTRAEIEASAPEPRAFGKPPRDAIPPGAVLATVKQAMAALSVSRGTIDNLVKDGKLVRSHIGRAARIEVASIFALIMCEKTGS